MDKSEKVREARLRRVLARRGYSLSRSSTRDPGAADYGRYTIRHAIGNKAFVCNVPHLGGVEDWVAKHDWLNSGHAEEDLANAPTVYAPGAFDGCLPAPVPVRYGEGGPVAGEATVTRDDKGLSVSARMLPRDADQEA